MVDAGTLGQEPCQYPAIQIELAFESNAPWSRTVSTEARPSIGTPSIWRSAGRTVRLSNPAMRRRETPAASSLCQAGRSQALSTCRSAVSVSSERLFNERLRSRAACKVASNLGLRGTDGRVILCTRTPGGQPVAGWRSSPTFRCNGKRRWLHVSRTDTDSGGRLSRFSPWRINAR